MEIREGPLCPHCNWRQIELGPMYDNQQTQKVTCRDCRRKIRAGEEIIKFDRSKIVDNLRSAGLVK